MIHIKKEEINEMNKIYRLNLINSMTGYKPANLIGTQSKEKNTNLAIISSVVHLGSNPPLLGFILRPAVVPRHTYSNIKETGFFTINHVHANFVDNAHYTSAKFDEQVSEFDSCEFSREYLDDFPAPFVKESKLKIGLNFLEEYEIGANKTIFVIGEIQSIYMPKEILKENGDVNLNAIDDVCISGLNNYHEVNQIGEFKYARPGIKPENLLKR